MTPDQRQLNFLNASILADDIERDEARGSLSKFAQYINPEYINARHAQVLCHYLDRWAFGDIDRLMVFMPPRHGKSEHVSRLCPAHILGRNPNAEIIACSYGASLASDMNTDVQRFIQSPRYAELFPKTKLGGKRVVTLDSQPKLNSQTFEIVGANGTYICAGVNGPISGKGFTHGIIDDVIKNREEADSITYRDRNEDWYDSVFWQRRNTDRAKICLTVTRWHEDDLPGRLLARMKKGGEQWVVLCLPRICEDSNSEGEYRSNGEVLWPERLSLADALIGRANNPYEFSAIQQQSPTNRSGNAIRREWFEDGTPTKYCMFFNPEDVLQIRLAYDVAFTDSPDGDWTWGSLKAKMKDGSFVTLWQHFGHWSNEKRRANIGTFGLQVKKMMEELFPNIPWRITEEAGVGAGVEVTKADINYLIGLGLPASAFEIKKQAKATRAVAWLSACEARRTKLYAGSQLSGYGMSNGTELWINHFMNLALRLRYSEDGLEFKGGKDDMIDAEVEAQEGLTQQPKRNYFAMN